MFLGITRLHNYSEIEPGCLIPGLLEYSLVPFQLKGQMTEKVIWNKLSGQKPFLYLKHFSQSIVYDIKALFKYSILTISLKSQYLNLYRILYILSSTHQFSEILENSRMITQFIYTGMFLRFLPRVNPVVIVVAIPGNKKRNKI